MKPLHLKKHILILLILSIATYQGAMTQNRTIAYAQTTEPTSEATSPAPTKEQTPVDETIKNLKEKIENKVNEINKTNKSVITGLFSSVEGKVIKIKTSSDKTFDVTLDDTITQFFSSDLEGAESIDSSDLSEGDYLVITGPTIDEEISANKIYQQTQYSVLQGQIIEVDKANFNLTIVTSDKDEMVVDIEDETVQIIMDSKTTEVTKAGFSKFKIGDNIHVAGTLSADEKTITAIRTLVIPQEYFAHEAAETTPSPTPEN